MSLSCRPSNLKRKYIFINIIICKKVLTVNFVVKFNWIKYKIYYSNSNIGIRLPIFVVSDGVQRYINPMGKL